MGMWTIVLYPLKSLGKKMGERELSKLFSLKIELEFSRTIHFGEAH
jgi:hypothetical protein